MTPLSMMKSLTAIVSITLGTTDLTIATDGHSVRPPVPKPKWMKDRPQKAGGPQAPAGSYGHEATDERSHRGRSNAFSKKGPPPQGSRQGGRQHSGGEGPQIGQHRHKHPHAHNKHPKHPRMGQHRHNHSHAHNNPQMGKHQAPQRPSTPAPTTPPHPLAHR